MGNTSRKLMLILVMLALAVAPLRGTLALPSDAAAEPATHCAGMQADRQAANPDVAMPDMHHEQAEPRNCKQGCDGSCCDTGCSGCAPLTPAIPATAITPAGITGATPRVTVPARFHERFLTPPLRPPVSLHS